MRYSAIAFTMAAFGIVVPLTHAAAQEVTAATAAPSPETAPANELEQRVAALEALQAAKPAPQLKTDFSPNGLRFSSSDGYEMRLKTLVQADGNFYFEDARAPKTNTLKLRRVRLIVEAKLPAKASLRLQPDFSQGKVTMLDSYVDIMPVAWLGLRAGKFKTPVGLERLFSAPTLMFPDTSLTSTLTPNRDVGLQLQGTVGAKLLTYALGVFNGVVDGGNGDLDTDDEKDFVARVFSEPLAATDNHYLRGLGLGVGASVGHQYGSYYQKTEFAPTQSLAALRAAGGTPYFSFLAGASYAGTVVADGANRRLAPQGYYFAGPVGIVAEYVQTRHHVKRAGQSDDIRFDAWSATGGVVLTGDRMTPGGVAPEHPVGEGIGAWQVAGRVGELIVDHDAFPTYANPARSARAARAAGVALNWYPTATLRASVAYEKTRFEPAADGVPALPAERFLMARVQLGFL